jgi:hypothetical protein
LYLRIGSFLNKQFPKMRLNRALSKTSAPMYFAYGMGDWHTKVKRQVVGLHYFPVLSHA